MGRTGPLRCPLRARGGKPVQRSGWTIGRGAHERRAACPRRRPWFSLLFFCWHYADQENRQQMDCLGRSWGLSLDGVAAEWFSLILPPLSEQILYQLRPALAIQRVCSLHRLQSACLRGLCIPESVGLSLSIAFHGFRQMGWLWSALARETPHHWAGGGETNGRDRAPTQSRGCACTKNGRKTRPPQRFGES